MTSDLEELGRRAVACKHWRWMPGMSVVGWHDRRVCKVTEGVGFERWFRQIVPLPAPAIPDLTDPATLGCLLALVREAWGQQSIYVGSIRDVGWWEVYGRSSVLGAGATEAEALVAALEAAP